MIQKLKKLSDVLPGLIGCILLYGVICELIGVLLVKEKLFYSIGLLAGILCAILMAIHMAWSLNRALDFDEKSAVKMMQKHNIIRYGVVVVIFMLLLVTNIGNPLAAFLGVMGLKVAAYLTPIAYKFIRR